MQNHLTCIYLCVIIQKEKIEAHSTKSIARKRPPRSCKKGVSAEADTVACILAGSSDNIRSAVVEIRSAII